MLERFIIFVVGFVVGNFFWILAILLSMLSDPVRNKPRSKDEWRM